MPDLWTYLKSTDKKIVLYGTGNGADKILNQLERCGIKIHGIFASDGFVRDREFREFKVKSYAALKEELGEFIVLMCFGSSRPEVLAFVEQIRAENEFYLPDVPVYGDIVFDEAFYITNKSRFERVEEFLEDELSQKTYRNVINYKLSGDIRYLLEAETTEEEEESLIRLEAPALLIDCGAYIGDTVQKYSRVYGDKLNRIIAIEPDKRNYRKLNSYIETCEQKELITAIKAAVSDADNHVYIQDNTGRGVHLDGNSVADGDAQNVTDIVRVDTVYNRYPEIQAECRDILLKMDVEGNEIKALHGASNLIIHRRPKMVIACYHRNDDFITIPEYILSIKNDYKIKIRHLPGLPCWDTSFYFY